MPARKKKPTAAKKPAKGEPVVPDRIFALASPRSIGGVSMFEGQERISAATVANFFSPPDLVHRAAQRLQDAGFEILQITSMTINIAGSAETYQRAFNTKIVAEERLGAPTKALRSQLANVTDLHRLKRMHRRAVKAATWQEFLDAPCLNFIRGAPFPFLTFTPAPNPASSAAPPARPGHGLNVCPDPRDPSG